LGLKYFFLKLQLAAIGCNWLQERASFGWGWKGAPMLAVGEAFTCHAGVHDLAHQLL